ncbi:MAG: hypothetical protein CSYNP_02483 [Syntrophus sp. SKADARSKE-3]|nr:hypothetical protein [Syntrophus sp. SKADARSKE-3]
MNVLVRPSTYDAKDLHARFFEIMDALGGAEIPPGSRVLLKPNLLSPAKPEEAVLTHPLVIRAAVEYVLARNATPLVFDSPAMGSFEKILRDGGIRAALEGLNVTCRPFQASDMVDIGPPFGEIDLAREALEADVVINLPKLKTHGQMLLTLGVKNLFDCVVGYRKPEWHMRAGIDKAMFARLLVLIARRIRPAFTVLDGILALEGEGPGKGGIPRHIGVLMGSREPLALDLAVCRMLGLSPAMVPTLKIADEMGFLPVDCYIEGALPEIHDFCLPDMGSLIFGPPSLQRLSRLYLIQRPAADMTACKLCGECVKICPAKAVIRRDSALQFDYNACIRCYCCLEVCPYGAIRKMDNPVARVFRSVAEKIL